MNKAEKQDKRTLRETQAKSQQITPKRYDLVDDIERVTGVKKSPTGNLSNAHIQTVEDTNSQSHASENSQKILLSKYSTSQLEPSRMKVAPDVIPEVAIDDEERHDTNCDQELQQINLHSHIRQSIQEQSYEEGSLLSK